MMESKCSQAKILILILICKAKLWSGSLILDSFFQSDLIFQQAAGEKRAQILKAHENPPTLLTSLIITFHQQPRCGVSAKTDEASNALHSSLWTATQVLMILLTFFLHFSAPKGSAYILSLHRCWYISANFPAHFQGPRALRILGLYLKQTEGRIIPQRIVKV